ncbi:MAG: hypothetical protein PWQ87_146 [Candidatus Woesearchaeota archaeon]|nr:hypothetical protein [Candidatus Woesearchaeota archaeon]
MALFGIGKKKAEKNSSEALDKLTKLNDKNNSKSDKSFSGKVGFTKPKENGMAKGKESMPSNNVEEDLNWDDLLPGFEEKKDNDNLSLPEDNSNPFFSLEKGADELDRLASEAGLNSSEQPASIPKVPKEEVEKTLQENPKKNKTEGKKEEKEESAENSEEESKEEQEEEEIIKQGPKQRKESYPSSFKTFIRANSVFLPQDGYNEFYNFLKKAKDELASLELDQQEVKDYDNELKKSGNAFVGYLRAISSTAMQSEDIIRSGGDLNE